MPELVARIAAKLAAENGIDAARGSRDHGHCWREHGVHARGARDIRAGRRDHPARSVLLQPRDGDPDGRVPAVAVPTDARYQPDLDAIGRAITRPHARRRHDLAEQSERRRLSRAAVACGQRTLPRPRACTTSPTRPTSTSRTDRARHVSPGSLRAAAPTRSRSTRCRRPTAWPAGASATSSIPDDLTAAMLKIQDTILICPHDRGRTGGVGGARCRARVLRSARARAGGPSDKSWSTLSAAWAGVQRAACRRRVLLFLRMNRHEDGRDDARGAAHPRAQGRRDIPGSAFGMSDGCYFRVAFGALQRETVAEGIGRLVTGLRAICG